MTEDSQRSQLKLRPGAIRQLPGNDRKWVVVTSTSYRMMDDPYVYDCSTMCTDASTLVGFLPPDELDSTVWCDRYTLPKSCINHPRKYEPVWDADSVFGGRWLSRSLSSGRLYNVNGTFHQPAEPDQPQGDPVTDSSPAGAASALELRPGIIRHCTTVDKKWVVIDSTHWRWMDHQYVDECSSAGLSDNPSTVIGMLPPDERDSTVWSEAYALPYPCISNAKEYEPVWNAGAAGWLSRHLDSGILYDMNGSRVIPEPTRQPQPALAASGSLASAAVVRFFKKYW